MTRNILIAMAVIPAIWLMIKVYQADKLEKEPVGFLIKLALLGVVATVLAGVTETVGALVLQALFSRQPLIYLLLFYFGVVALSEEGFKYLLLKNRTWRSPYFNCQFDGVVYAVFVSLGFALWENIAYVLQYGLATALVRAVTAVPGHACFGVFMGVWYGAAKRYELAGAEDTARIARRRALLIPALLHGCYDFIATVDKTAYSLIFAAFVIVLFLLSYRLIRRASRNDGYIA